jgi:hypothetical protein
MALDKWDPDARTVLRKYAAKALVKLYQDKKLNEGLRKLVLDVRDKITKHHSDQPSVCTLYHSN